MITGINEIKILRKHKSYKRQCKLDGRKCNSNQKRNNNKCRCECKNLKEHIACEKDYVWSPARCSCKNGKYFSSIIIDESVITCDKNIETTKTVPTKTVPIKSTSTSFYILLTFLLITIRLMIAFNCYLIKY